MKRIEIKIKKGEKKGYDEQADPRQWQDRLDTLELSMHVYQSEWWSELDIW